jgi:hypothetical protein
LKTAQAVLVINVPKLIKDCCVLYFKVYGCFSLLFVAAWAFVPESPRWLILRGKEYSASKSLEWLRGRNDAAIDREIEKIKRDIAAK